LALLGPARPCSALDLGPFGPAWPCLALLGPAWPWTADPVANPNRPWTLWPASALDPLACFGLGPFGLLRPWTLWPASALDPARQRRVLVRKQNALKCGARLGLQSFACSVRLRVRTWPLPAHEPSPDAYERPARNAQRARVRTQRAFGEQTQRAFGDRGCASEQRQVQRSPLG
jgi:hypothetical protein